MGTSPSQQRNLELVGGGMASWIAGDRDDAMATFTEDVEIFVPPELGNAGSYRGLEEFRRWFAAWDEAWSEFTMSVESIEPVGDRHVVAMIHSKGTGAGSGIEVENVLGWAIGVRDDRMEYLALQPDRDSALELARSREG